MTKVFIDGSHGTTGLRINNRLAERKDISLIALPEKSRKDPLARKDAMNEADVIFLCLPDDAAKEAVSLAQGVGGCDGEKEGSLLPDGNFAVIIDTSTAHRTAEGWTYGFPEIRNLREAIRTSKRIANPGCHASGFIALIAPLIGAGVLAADEKLTCVSLTGYSGGGKKMIAEYENPMRDRLLEAPRVYGLSQNHKHLPEMVKVCGLEKEPIFTPVVADFYAGMEVIIPIYRNQISCGRKELEDIYRSYYSTGVVRYMSVSDGQDFLSAAAFAGRDDMQITVAGNEERILLISRFDNLGKGASGAAIQNMNIVLGLDEDVGLNLI